MKTTPDNSGEQVAATLQRLFIDLLDESHETQSRQAVSAATVAEYVEVLERCGPEVDPFPPIDVFNGDGEYFIADGWHRYDAYRANGRMTIPAMVRVGTKRDAILFAAGANRAHGLKRSNADKRRAVEIMLRDPEWSEWSNVRLSEHCGVSDEFVRKVRSELPTVGSSEPPTVGGSKAGVEEPDGEPRQVEPPKPITRVGRDGKRRQVAVPKTRAAGAVDVPKLAAIYVQALKDLRRMRRDFELAAENQATGGHLAPKLQRVITDLANLKATLRMAEPVALCGKCGGRVSGRDIGCQYCARTGFWPRGVVEGLRAGEKLDAKNKKRT